MTCNKREGLIAVIAFSVALMASLLYADGRYGLEPDGARELSAAHSLASGEGLVEKVIHDVGPPRPLPIVTKPPLFILLLAAAAKLGFNPKEAGWFISQMSFAASAGFLYALARLALPSGVALLVSVLFSVQIAGLHWSIFPREDSLFVTLIVASLWLCGRVAQGQADSRKGSWFMLGALVAATVLTRYLGVALLIAISSVLLLDWAQRRIGVRELAFFAGGVTVVGIAPLTRFLILFGGGTKPAFYAGQDYTWFPIMAGVVHALQRDYLGRSIVWLYDQTLGDWLLLGVSFAALCALLLFATRERALLPLSAFVAVYLMTLIGQLAWSGLDFFEARYAMPVEGLLLILMAWLVWKIALRLGPQLRAVCAVGALAAVGIFLLGQVARFKEISSFTVGPDASREYCPASQTIGWVKQNIPAGSVIMGPQCFYQLLAETGQYYWLPVPPADEYNSSSRFQVRWAEDDFLRAARRTGAKWVVMLNGPSGDPLSKKPGYGTFVTDLLAGKETATIRRVAAFTDGFVYSIQGL